MHLIERLKSLKNHEVSILAINGLGLNGIITETDEEYIVIETEESESNEDAAGDAFAASAWHVKVDALVAVGHPFKCKSCVINGALQKGTGHDVQR